MPQHLTDNEAFPVESTALNATALAYNPTDGCRTLSANGSHPPIRAGDMHPQRCTYSQDELRDLVAYATDRGVRVVPEFGTCALTSATVCVRMVLCSTTICATDLCAVLLFVFANHRYARAYGVGGDSRREGARQLSGTQLQLR